MVKIGPNGFEFDNITVHTTTLTRSTTSMTENKKRIKINIDYSSSNLTNTPHIITINNSKINADDNIIANIVSNGAGHAEIFLNTFHILDGSAKLVLKALGSNITNTVNIVILVIT